jgi:hypothetical protein
VGEIQFGPVPAGEVLAQGRAGRFTIHDGGSAPTAAIDFVTTNPGGGFHSHPAYQLFGDAARNAQSADPPTNGVYLASARAEIAGVGVANPIYMVLGLGVDARVLEDARLWVQAFIVPVAPGDFDGDGEYDAGDYQSWADRFGDASYAGLGPDGNGDGVVNAADFTVWRDAMGDQPGALFVPEPSAVWSVFAAAALARPRRARPRDQSCVVPLLRASLE